jgi:phosphate starvation-inducible PhoH-like protein
MDAVKAEVKLPDTADRLRVLFGPNDANLRMLRAELGVRMVPRNGILHISGGEEEVSRAINLVERLIEEIEQGETYLAHELAALMEVAGEDERDEHRGVIHTEVRRIEPRTEGQDGYIHAIRAHPLTFGMGPAGTGKTYLAVACAVEALRHGDVRRIILTRPAVEAGERLGFLPGDLREKVDPYLRPIYDALGDMISRRQLAHYIETGVIEIAPLAFMRGRTLNRSFVILDEAQNTTTRQMKMLLTRLGEEARCVVTGDVTQVDLSATHTSGLLHASDLLEPLPDVAVVRLSGADIVRHELVRRIVQAYDEDEAARGGPPDEGGAP